MLRISMALYAFGHSDGGKRQLQQLIELQE
jgi:hypothetical protein